MDGAAGVPGAPPTAEAEPGSPRPGRGGGWGGGESRKTGGTEGRKAREQGDTMAKGGQPAPPTLVGSQQPSPKSRAGMEVHTPALGGPETACLTPLLPALLGCPRCLGLQSPLQSPFAVAHKGHLLLLCVTRSFLPGFWPSSAPSTSPS